MQAHNSGGRGHRCLLCRKKSVQEQTACETDCCCVPLFHMKILGPGNHSTHVVFYRKAYILHVTQGRVWFLNCSCFLDFCIDLKCWMFYVSIKCHLTKGVELENLNNSNLWILFQNCWRNPAIVVVMLLINILINIIWWCYCNIVMCLYHYFLLKVMCRCLY